MPKRLLCLEHLPFLNAGVYHKIADFTVIFLCLALIFCAQRRLVFLFVVE